MCVMDTITTPTLESTTNLLFANQKVVPDNTSRINPVMTTSDLPKQFSMPESDWSFASAGDRPIALGTGTWVTTDALGKTLVNFEIPNATYTLNYYFVSMLKFMSYFRCDIRLRVQMNSNRFNQGVLLAYFVPLRVRNIVPDSVNAPGSCHLFNTTLLPHAFLDASQSTDASIVIPWTHFATFLPISNTFTEALNSAYLIGTLYVDVLVPLVTAAAASPTVNFYVYFEPINTRLHVPTEPRGALTSLSPEGLEGAFAGAVSTARSIFSAVSNVMGYNFRGAVNDAAAAVDGIKVIVDNLDKPLDPISGRRMLTISGNYTALDGVDQSIRLSAGAAATTYHPESVVGDANAEMDIGNIVKLHTIIDITAWTVIQTPGTLLTTYLVHPFYWLITPTEISGTDYNLYDASNLAAIASRFCFWKGSIKFILKIVNTSFHTGRLRIVFRPNSDLPPTTFASSASYPQMIFDIREEKEVTFTIPYVSHTPWKQSLGAMYTVSNSSGITLDEILGSLSIYVQTQLSAPSTVANFVSLIVMQAGGEDFQVSTLNSAPFDAVNNLPVIKNYNAVLPALDMSSASLAKRLLPQGDEAPTSDQQDRQEVVSQPQMNELVTTDRLVSSLGCVMNGETISSIKQVVKRYEPVYFDYSSATASQILIFLIPVFPKLDAFCTTNTDLDNNEFVMSNHLSWFSSLYAYWRGSMRFKLTCTSVPGSNPSNLSLTACCHQPIFFSDPFAGINPNPSANFSSDQLGNFGSTYENQQVMPTLHVEVPYATQMMSLATDYFSTGDGSEASEVMTVGQLSYFLMSNSAGFASGATNVLISQAGGDDFLLHWYIGPQTMVKLAPEGLRKDSRLRVVAGRPRLGGRK